MPAIELRAHQQEVIDWTDSKFDHLNPHRFGLFFAPRTGKTYIILGLLKKYNVAAIIIVPKAIKKQWQEMTEFSNHLIVTKEEFRRDHKILPRYEAFIFDEAHHASNIKSGISKACWWYMKTHNPKYRWLATGTPYRSSPLSIFGLGKLLGMNWNYYTFINTFYSMVRMGMRMVPVIRSGMEIELERYVRAIGITLNLEDVVETKEPVAITKELEMTIEQEDAIKNLSESMAITRFTKIHEIEQGFLKGDEYTEDVEIISPKQKEIVELVRLNKKIAIVCRYKYQINMISQLLNFTNVFIIDGDTKDKAQMVKDIALSERCAVIIQSACCEGYDLSSIDTMIFASMSFSHSDHIQMKDRLVHLDKPKVNTYYYLLGGKIDQAVYENVMKKMDFHMQIFAKEYEKSN